MTRGLAGHSPSNVQKYLKGQDYPARKEELIRTAQKNKAPSEVMEVIKRLPEDEFGGPQDVMKAYGEEERQNGGGRNSGHQASSQKRSSSATQDRKEVREDENEDDENVEDDQ
jgi:Protein of unknown function (DUF2795)